jgi:hypothetical protein
MARVLLPLVFLFTCGVAAANNDDGFIWVDANTKIRLKPIGNAGAGATKAPEPEPKKDEKKKEAPKK